ncbi:relaxase domain-containing protein [Phycicoccus sp. MAQZ13P-2]|uniref:MobF family relaxase n=1 Tax=Phycicoccus mangrovi TaxID=2840470 RepID=UPI001C00353F|nr:MobF family relaxase [Phycicoccus mangrovi]MBT9276395.1 relaxase domain-containing protein [Phycicoccus mangrovi]
MDTQRHPTFADARGRSADHQNHPTTPIPKTPSTAHLMHSGSYPPARRRPPGAGEVPLGGVTMSLHKLTAGTGYTYLTRQVAAHDRAPTARASLASYYTERGETPGRWVGSGLAGIDGLQVGDEVTEEQMRALFGAGLHPLAAERSTRLEGPDLTGPALRAATRLGTPYKVYTHDTPHFLVEVARRVEEHAATLGHPRDYPVDADTKAAIRSAVAAEMFAAEHGRVPSGARELAAAVARYSRPRTRAVAGFDLTFSPVKSVSALWALAPPDVAAQVEQAHHDAVRDALNYLEEQAVFTREGADGVRQVETTGLVAAAFTHRDSRAGDPDLHTHVAVANKVQARGSGSWLAIDGRILYKAHVSASETYNTALEAHLRRRLGVRFAARPGPGADTRPVREIVGIDPALLARWSSRRQLIDTRREALATTFQHDHGRPPTTVEALHLAQQATLETREDKHPPCTLDEQRTAWRREADAVLGEHRVDAMVRAAVARDRGRGAPPPDRVWVERTGKSVLNELQSRRSTWQVWHVRAEAQRQVRALHLDPHLLQSVVSLVTDTALACSVRITPDSDGIPEPQVLRRTDGSSVYEVAGETLFTSSAILAAEERIITAAGVADRPVCSEEAISLILLEHAANGAALNPGQAALVRSMANSGARIQLALAPAGAGKTTAMRALTSAWTEGGGTVLGLAPSAAAASVLRESTGAPTDTLAKLAWSLTHEADRPAWVENIGPKTLVIVDEAAMADTLTLDTVITHVLERGGQVRLIGDTRQLSAIGAGGILRDIADVHGAVHLHQLMRFTDPAEGLASLSLRDGRPEALGFYLDHHRVHVGDTGAITEAAFLAWATDRSAGRDSLMLAPTRELVAALNERAQTHHLGNVPRAGGIPLADGAYGHVGDVVITRRNARRLALSSTDWVKNGDRWNIVAIADDGSVTVRHIRSHHPVTLPPAYVHDSVELGYAATTHAAQGLSVDTVHGLATGTESRQQLYTLLTRGADANHLYLQLAGDGDPHSTIRPDAIHPPTATEVLESILARDDAPCSATTLRRVAATPESQLHAAVTRYTDALHVAASHHLGRSAIAQLDRDADRLVPGILDEAAWPSLRSHLTLMAVVGTAPADALAEAIGQRDLDSASDRAAVLTWRLDDWRLRLSGPGPLPWLPPVPSALEADGDWGGYLCARGDLVRALAALVQDVPATGPPPDWWPAGTRVEPDLLQAITLWRAAQGVPEHDLRPTGPPMPVKAAALWQNTLEARLGTRSPALAEWGDLLRRLAPRACGDSFTPLLAQRLAAVHRFGLDTLSLLTTAVLAPLPDNHAAAALWWRISRHLSPSVAHHVENTLPVSTDWTQWLTRVTPSPDGEPFISSPWWPSLLTLLDEATARGTRSAELEQLCADAQLVEPEVDPCQALVWRLSLLSDPPPTDDRPRPEDFADDEAEREHPGQTPRGDPAPETPSFDELQTRLTAAVLVRRATEPLPRDDHEIEQMVRQAAAWDDAPFTRVRAAALNAQARDYYASLLNTAWAGPYLRERLRLETPPPGAGYAPPGWTHLTRRLTDLGATPDELIAIGLSCRTQSGGLVDRFRDRLIFPVTDDGVVLGFVARRHPEADHHRGPKYLNTSSTVLFDKGCVLYGMDRTISRAGAIPVVVEGPLDAEAITAAGAGRYRGVAVMGTALTPTQARLIASLHASPVVAFDHDAAGRAATERTFWLLAARGAMPREVSLPQGADPASFVHDQGPVALAELLSRSTPIADRLTHELLNRDDPAAWAAACRVITADDPAVWTERAQQAHRHGTLPPIEVLRSLVEAAEAWNDQIASGRPWTPNTTTQNWARRATARPLGQRAETSATAPRWR